MREQRCADCGAPWRETSWGSCVACFEAWVAASCEAQGVPVKVTDPTVLRRIAVLLS